MNKKPSSLTSKCMMTIALFVGLFVFVDHAQAVSPERTPSCPDQQSDCSEFCADTQFCKVEYEPAVDRIVCCSGSLPRYTDVSGVFCIYLLKYSINPEGTKCPDSKVCYDSVVPSIVVDKDAPPCGDGGANV